MRRLTDTTDDGTTEARAGRLLGHVAPPPPLSPAQLARIRATLEAAGTPARRWRFAAVLAPLALLLGLGLTLYARGPRATTPAPVSAKVLAPVAPSAADAPPAADAPIDLKDGHLVVRSGESSVVVETPGARITVRPRGVVSITVTGSRVVVAAASGSAAVEYHERHQTLEVTAGSTVGTVEPKESAPTSELSAESAALAAALRLSRHDHDPAGALEALDALHARHPHGALRDEADLARLDALLALHRSAEALALVDGIDLRGRARADGLGLMRAELRAQVGRCEAALADLDAVEARLAPPLRARATAVRGVCAK